MANNKRNIKYINKTFDDFRSQLIEFSKSYFPNTYSDFNEASPGMMIMEQSAYVGDVLSFYLDNQIQETFLQHSRQANNLYELAYMFGYQPKTTGLATVDLEITQLVPAIEVSGQKQPNLEYSLKIPANTVVSSNGVQFLIEDEVDFSIDNYNSPTVVSIAETLNAEPSKYLLSKTVKAYSGTIKSTTFTMGDYEEFPTKIIQDSNIASIVDIFDSEGNKYYEVDYLGQELVFEGVKNTNENDPNLVSQAGEVPYILKTKSTQYRFTTRFISPTELQVQFGSGNANNFEGEIIPNPTNIGLGLPYGKSPLNSAFAPQNFIFTNTYGVAPVNTTLTVRYLSGGGISSNVPSNTINNIDKTNITFNNSSLADNNLAQSIFDSLSVNNSNPASGGQSGDTIEEIRQNTIANYNSQLRNVTKEDYLVRTLSMPAKYGAISKAFTQKPNIDDSENTIDIYVLSYDNNGHLIPSPSGLKKNLKTYLNEYRMIGDSIRIKDGYVINIGCNFEIITLPNFNNNDVLLSCIRLLQDYFQTDKWQINQPILISDLRVLLDNVEGVMTIKKLEIVNKTGNILGYSDNAYDIKGATQNDVVYPSIDPSIFELKYPNNDITGKVVTI